MLVGKGAQFQHKGYGQGTDKSKFQNRLTKDERRRLKCAYCQENGHEIHECFKLHSYLEWYKKT